MKKASIRNIFLFCGLATGTTAVAYAISQKPVEEVNPAAILRRSIQPVSFSRSYSGTFVYLVNVLPPGPPRPIVYDIVVHTVGSNVATQAKASVFQVSADFGDLLFDCELSPNARYLLLKEGLPYDPSSTYRIHFLDLKTKQIFSGPDEQIRNQTVAWSPDSRYVAYVEGGDTTGFETFGLPPLRLNIYDLKRGVSKFVFQNPGVGEVTWTQQKSLLFTFKPVHSTNLDEDTKQESSIYEYRVKDEAVKKIIDNASGPAPSPNGRYILFSGGEDLSTGANNTKADIPHSGLCLYLFDCMTHKRIFIQTLSRPLVPENIVWSSDSKNAYYIVNNYRSESPVHEMMADPKLYPGHGAGTVYTIAVPKVAVSTLEKHKIITLEADDISARQNPEPQFQFNEISAKGLLSIQISKIGHKQANSPFLDSEVSMYELNPQSGVAVLSWKAKNLDVYSWQPMAMP